MRSPEFTAYMAAAALARQVRETAMKYALDRYFESLDRDDSIENKMAADERYADLTWAAHTVYRQALQAARKAYDNSKQTA